MNIHYLDYQETEHGYNWAIFSRETLPNQEKDQYIRTGFSKTFLDILNSLYTITTSNGPTMNTIYTPSLPKNYDSRNISGYLNLIATANGQNPKETQYVFSVSRRSTNPGHISATKLYLEYPAMLPVTGSELYEAAPRSIHPEFWGVTTSDENSATHDREITQVKAALKKHDDEWQSKRQVGNKKKTTATKKNSKDEWKKLPVMKNVVVYATDASVDNTTNTTPPSIAWMNSEGEYFTRRIKSKNTTSHTAELKAIEAAITHATPLLKEGKHVLIMSDNQVAVMMMKRQTPKNLQTCLHLTWVKGHSGHPLNEAADRLAKETRLNSSKESLDEKLDIIAKNKLNAWNTHLLSKGFTERESAQYSKVKNVGAKNKAAIHVTTVRTPMNMATQLEKKKHHSTETSPLNITIGSLWNVTEEGYVTV